MIDFGKIGDIASKFFDSDYIIRICEKVDKTVYYKVFCKRMKNAKGIGKAEKSYLTHKVGENHVERRIP